MNALNLFVITGGPGSGKTTVLRELEKHGVSHVPEVARLIIQEQVRSDGDALPWKNRELYTQIMLERSIESFKEYASVAKPTLADRGIPDTLSYAHLIGLSDKQAVSEACEQYRYAPRVFFAPPWREIYHTDDERKQDYTEAVRTAEQIVRTYQECGYEIVDLPKVSPAARAEFILGHLKPTS